MRKRTGDKAIRGRKEHLPGVLLNANFNPFAGDQFVKDRQNLFAVLVDALQPGPGTDLVAVPEHHLIQQLARDIDIAAQGVGRMAPQEEAVKKRRLPLGSQWVKLFHRFDRRLHTFEFCKNSSIN